MSKALNLEIMFDMGLNVPEFFVVDSVYDLLPGMMNSDLYYSVRSSGNISTPGRMQTFLNVHSSKIPFYVERVLHSGKEKRVIEYLNSINYPIDDFKVQCIIQKYIPVRPETSDISAVIHVHSNSGKIEMQYANVPGDQLMSGEITPKQTDIDVSDLGYSEIYQATQKLKNRFNSDLEIEVTRYKHVWYFLQFRTAYFGNEDVIENTPSQSQMTTNPTAFARYVINGREIGGILTRNINVDQPSEHIYLTDDTSFDDLTKLLQFKAILTTRGGSMCHAGAICRIHGKTAMLTVENHTALTDGDCIKIFPVGEIYTMVNKYIL